jgi:surface antigen
MAMALLCAILAPLAGCASGNVLARAETDRSLITNSIPSSAAGAGTQTASDEAAVRAAVSSADPGRIAPTGVPWTNPATGSSGEISQLSEYRDGDASCRRFTTSRQSFDGVALYHGEACLDPTGGWYMRRFDPS